MKYDNVSSCNILCLCYTCIIIIVLLQYAEDCRNSLVTLCSGMFTQCGFWVSHSESPLIFQNDDNNIFAKTLLGFPFDFLGYFIFA